MSEAVPKDATWIDKYQPLANIREIEQATQQIPLFSQITDGLTVIASGSPRNPRFLQEINKLNVAQLPQSAAAKMLSDATLSDGVQDIVERIKKYTEPKSKWSANGDEGLSLEKARITLASILLLTGDDLIPGTRLAVLSRDYNIADSTGDFFDRPGNVINLDRLIPEGWAVKGQGAPPISPVEQYERLYKSENQALQQPHFYVANTTSLLTLKLPEQVFVSEIRQTLDSSAPLPDWVSQQSICSFMALLPERGIIHSGINGASVRALIDYYNDMPGGPYGNPLYAIPGIVDWSRPPFNRYIKVWQPRNRYIISQQFPTDFSDRGGRWVDYLSVSRQDRNIENELVGVSTNALKWLDLCVADR